MNLMLDYNHSKNTVMQEVFSRVLANTGYQLPYLLRCNIADLISVKASILRDSIFLSGHCAQIANF